MQPQKYEFDATGIHRNTRNGREQLTNFTAEITNQQKRHNANETTTILTITGQHNKKPLPPIQVNAKDFGTLGWVNQWGMEIVVMPLPNAEKEIKAAIQLRSKPKTQDVYTHIGWYKGEYLIANGAITKDGITHDRNVALPPELTKYRFEPPKTSPRTAFRESLNLHRIADPQTAWPLLLATYRAPIGRTDYAIHVAGRSGTYKSETASLFQSHYGKEMDARQLPASWSSTANALEAIAYIAKDAIMVVDDFIPAGTAWQVRTLQKTADQLIRGQGNQAGRARLTDISSLQQTMYPRGLIISTGEDIPEGQSLRARMLIIEIEPDEINTAELTTAQQRRESYPEAMQRWIQHLAQNPEIRKNHKKNVNERRNNRESIGHARTLPMIADLEETANQLMKYALNKKYLTPDETVRTIDSAMQALSEQGKQQDKYIATTDPTTAFIDTIKQIIGANLGHIRTINGTRPILEVPTGWTQRERQGETTWKANGPTIGWVKWEEETLYIDENSLPLIKRYAAGRIAMTQQTLIKRLKDAKILTKTDAARNRNTVRIKCDGATRQTLAINLNNITGENE